MSIRVLILLAALLPSGAFAGESAVSNPVMSWDQVQALPLPPAGIRASYGPAPQQFGELRLPQGKGPFPVIVLIHGGCWLSAFDYVYITRLAAALTELGVATWTVEYRRLGDEGGGWPHTLLDVARATDHLRSLSRTHPLDLTRIASMGHSAGGHLALWLAARAQLPEDSELHLADALPVHAVFGLAPIADLATYRVGPPKSCNASVDRLLGGTPETQAQRYAQASPRALLPLGVPQWLLQGERDPIVPMEGVRAYARAAAERGDRVQVLAAPSAGHFEVSVPQSTTWPLLRDAVKTWLKS